MAKASINAMLGFMGSPRTSSYKLQTGDHLVDGVGAVRTTLFRWGQGKDDVVLDHIYETKVLSNVSHRPIHDICLHTEHVRVAQAFYMLQKAVKLSLRNIICVKTDCIVAHVPKRLEDVMKKEADVQFRQLQNLKWSYEPALFGEHRRLLEPLRMVAIDSCDPVFRFCTGGPLLGACKLPDIPEAQTFDPPEFEDVGQEQAKELALRGQSVLILGAAGTGKTYFTKEIVRELREQGKQAIVIAKTKGPARPTDSATSTSRTGRALQTP